MTSVNSKSYCVKVSDSNAVPDILRDVLGPSVSLSHSLFISSVLNRVPAGPAFISLCFLVRSIDAVGFAAAMTSSFAMTAKIFPNNVATVLVSAYSVLCDWHAVCARRITRRDKRHLYSQIYSMSRSIRHNEKCLSSNQTALNIVFVFRYNEIHIFYNV